MNQAKLWKPQTVFEHDHVTFINKVDLSEFAKKHPDSQHAILLGQLDKLTMGTMRDALNKGATHYPYWGLSEK